MLSAVGRVRVPPGMFLLFFCGAMLLVGGGGVVEVVEVVDCSLCLGVSADFVVCSEDLELQLIARESARIQQIIFGTDGN